MKFNIFKKITCDELLAVYNLFETIADDLLNKLAKPRACYNKQIIFNFFNKLKAVLERQSISTQIFFSRRQFPIYKAQVNIQRKIFSSFRFRKHLLFVQILGQHQRQQSYNAYFGAAHREHHLMVCVCVEQ